MFTLNNKKPKLLEKQTMWTQAKKKHFPIQFMSERILIALGIIQLIISTLQLLKLLWVYNPIIIIFFFFNI